MAVVFENSTAAGVTSGSSSTITFSFNSGTNADRLVLVGSAAASTDITAATYAGASMTLLDTQTPLKVYYRNGAASGANNLVLTSGTYKTVAYAAAAFSGVDATTPLGTPGKASGTGTAPASPSITFPTDGAIWGIVETGYTTGGSTLVAGSGTTLRSSARASSTGHWAAGGTRTTTGTLAWTGSYSTDWRVIGVPINAAGGVSSVTSDQSINWLVRSAVQADSAQAWTLRSAVQANSAQAWTLRSAVQADSAQAWTLRSAVQANSAQAWSVLNSTQAISDRSIAWTLRSAVQADSAQAWSVLNSTQAISDRSINWLVRSAVQADSAQAWTLRSAVQADSAQAWTLRSAVQRDSLQSWLTYQSVIANRDLAWAISTVESVTSDALLAWTMRASVTRDRSLSWMVGASAVPPVVRLKVTFTKIPTFVTRSVR